MSDIYKDGVEVHCPAVYISDSASEALEIVAQEMTDASNRAYDAYGNGDELTPEEFFNYFIELDEEED